MASKGDSGVVKVTAAVPEISPYYALMMAGRLLPLMALFGAAILYAHSLSPDQYALYQSMWMYVNVVTVIIGFGVTTVIFSTTSGSFIQFLKKNKSILLPLYAGVWIVTFLLFAFLTHAYTPQLKIWMAAFMILQASGTITESWIIKNGGETRYFIINILYSAVFFLWHWMVLYSGFDLAYLIQGVICLLLAKFLLLISFAIKRKSIGSPIPEQANLFAHWVYNGINDVIGVFGKWIDKLIMIYILTPAEFAVFFNGSFEIPLLSIFVSFTGSLMMVQMTKRMQNHQSIVPAFRENFLLLSIVIFPMFFFLYFFSEPVFHLVFGDQYASSVPVFMITLLVLPLRINNYGSMLQVLGRGGLVTRGSMIDLLLCIILIFILYPLMGMRGAALAIVISTFVQISFYLWQATRLLGTHITEMIPFKILIIRFAVMGIVFWLLKYFLRDTESMIKIIIAGTVAAVAFFIMGKSYFKLVLRTQKPI